MEITRRNFLRTSGAALLATGLLGSFDNVLGMSKRGQLYPLPEASLADPILYLTRAHFESHLNTVMRIAYGEKTVDLRLAEVPDTMRAENQKLGFYGESFSLILTPTSKGRISAGRYTVAHPVLGTFSLNINPVGKTNRLEAVINRINR